MNCQIRAGTVKIVSVQSGKRWDSKIVSEQSDLRWGSKDSK